MKNCKTCKNWNDGTADCAVAERAITNDQDIPDDVQAALDLDSADDENSCESYS